MDNRMFNVNGRTIVQLRQAVKLLLMTEYSDHPQKPKAWYFSKKRGFVLCNWLPDSTKKKAQVFTNRLGQPEPIEEEELVNILWDWLQSEEAKTVEFGEWEQNADHDGSNSLGWRLYTDSWGHVAEDNGSTIDHSTIGAFKPVYLWYGK